ncbi:MAG: hypothetical protein ACXABY_12370 [Candidatus Thorarchaeota archaeon]|jgi:hypothetical protein
MQKWEYKTVKIFSQQEPEGMLNELGNEGWEVVGQIAYNIILKRPAKIMKATTDALGNLGLGEE